MSANVVWHQAAVSSEERARLNGHRACILWYTGLSGAGKSTIANAVDRLLFERGCRSYVLDGDNIRHGLNADLGFDESSRHENIRRITEVANLFANAGLIVGTAFISPFRRDREQARRIAKATFVEIFIDAPVATCEQRDPKGLYNKAKQGLIENFTGISSPYEQPEQPDIHLRTAEISVEEAAQNVIDFLQAENILTNQ